MRISNHRTIDTNLIASPKADYNRISPRMTLRRKIDLNSNVYFSYGRYYQYLTLISVEMSTPFDVWFPLDKTVKPGESDHFILGYKNNFMEGLGFEAETYYKTYNNLTEFRSETDYEWNNQTGTLSDIYNMGKGYTYGLDILLKNVSTDSPASLVIL
jgi:outer membrane receptor protein involved in Fe transport